MKLYTILILAACAAVTVGTNLRLRPQEQQALYEHRFEIKEWFASGFERPTPANRQGPIGCGTCRLAIALALGLIGGGGSEEEVGNAIINLCISLDIVHEEVCIGAVNMYISDLMWIIEQRPWLTANDICGFMIEDCGNINPNMTNWNINIDQNKPPLVLYPRLPANTPAVKVLQMTDIHPDLHYTEGSLTKCGKPLCCRPDPLDDPSNSSIAAGHWGDYACDTPVNALDELFMSASRAHPDAQFILMTGDLVHHQIWNTTIPDNLDHYETVRRSMFAAWPTTPIYPVIGNHESHPCNMFPESDLWGNPRFNLSWLYNSIADGYSRYLPAEAQSTFRRAGYYTLRTTSGLRLIVLNTNFCYLNNFWLFYNTNDPEGHLQWLANTLLAAEQAKETVWLVGHVPPGSEDCWSVWSNKFLAIINRFEAIIKAQFYGHTHNDDIRIFFDQSANPPRPTGNLYIGASTTTYTDLNPGYKVFFADGVNSANATWEILNHETWIYNLTLANRPGGVPEWFKLYEARQAFNLPSFRPVDLYNLVVRMVTDDTLFQRFYSFYHKASDVAGSCDTACKMNYLCSIVGTDYTSTNCDQLEAIRLESLTTAQ